MELIIKICITLVVVIAGTKLLYWTWTSHIDPKATISKYVTQKPKIADMVVTRDSNKLYQNEASNHAFR